MKQRNLTITIGLILGGLLGSQVVCANPEGAQVVQGSASFSNPSANVLNINNSRNTIINWQSFNIGAGQTTNFIQPSTTSSVLNRVVSNNPSQILGNLNSNGRVFLINQHGIMVGEGAAINTNGFFASTLNITDTDFLNGKLKFADGGQGDIKNQGYIHAGEDGSIVLIAPNIENGGIIEVDNGNIILAAGKSISITSLQDSSIQFEVTSAENQVTNLGQVIAKNGAAGLFAGTLKHSGSIRASGLVQNADGSISLVATERVEVSGTVDVTGEQGGSIKILADTVDIQNGAKVDASGQSGGGEILIGGDQQGLNPDIKNSTSTTIAKEAEVHADAIDSGDGGKVIIFAKNDVHVHGDVSAKGGVNGGDGGFIETSGLQHLDITSVPDASASHGKAGEWLIDPNNITLVNGTGANTTSVISLGSEEFTSTDDSALLDVALIEAALLAGNNVTVSTGTSGTNSQDGDIYIYANITSTHTGNASLTFNAHDQIFIDTQSSSAVSILSTAGTLDLTLNADIDANGTGDITFFTGTGNSFPITIDTNGGVLKTNRNVQVSGESIVNFNNTIWNGFGLLNIQSASTLALDGGAGTLSLLAGNHLVGDGFVDGNVVVDGGSITGGTGSSSFGTLNITGSLTINSGLVNSVIGGFSTDWTSNSIFANTIDINGGDLMLVWDDAFAASNASNLSFFTQTRLNLMSCGGTGCMTGTGIGFDTVINPMLISNSTVILGDLNGDTYTYGINYLTDIVNNASIIEWAGNPSGNWNVNTNWMGGVIPSSSDYVFIENSDGAVNVDISDAQTAAGLQSTAAIRIDAGGRLTLGGDSFMVVDFFAGSGELKISGIASQLDGAGVLYTTPGSTTFLDQGVLVKDLVNWGNIETTAITSFQLDSNLVNNGYLDVTDNAGANSLTGIGSLFNNGILKVAANFDTSVLFENRSSGILDIGLPGVDVRLTGGSKLDGVVDVIPGSTLSLVGGNHTFVDGVNFAGDLNVTGSVVAIEGGLSIGILNFNGGVIDVNSLGTGSLFGNTLNASVINWGGGDSIISGDTSGAATGILDIILSDGLVLSGSSNHRFIGLNINHDGQIILQTATDGLTLTDSVMTTSSTGTIIGSGILDLQTGSDWIVTTAGTLMPEAMTLNFNGGSLTNIENLVFPGTVNVNQANFVQNGVITIPSTTTFNYFANDNILPSFGVVNNGTFVIQNNMADMDLSITDGSAFINNGLFDIASATTLHVLSDFTNNGTLNLAASSVLLPEAGALLTINGAITGAGSLSVNAGIVDFLIPTVLPAPMVVNLVSGNLSNAQNLTIAGNFNWLGGIVEGTGTGFTTEGQVNVTGGTLDTDWTIAPTGVVNWRTTGVNALSNANLVNQGELLIDPGVTGTVEFDFNLDLDNGLLGIESGIFRMVDGTGVLQDLVLDQAGDRLQGFGIFSGNVFNQFGTVTPGKSDPANSFDQTGTLTINGNYSQGANGTLDIKLDSTIDGLQHDRLQVAGLFNADGAINFRIVNNKTIIEIAALIDQSFVPLQSTSFAGRFAETTIPEGLNFTLGEGGLITISSDVPFLNQVANQLEVLLSADDLNFNQMVLAMRFVDRKARLYLDDEEDEESRAPRLVCK